MLTDVFGSAWADSPDTRPTERQRLAVERPAVIYCDGSIVVAPRERWVGRSSNPSPIAGTWGGRAVAESGSIVADWGGIVWPDMLGEQDPRPISNNDSELWGAMRVLDLMPDGWSGWLRTDSMVTLNRVAYVYSFRNHKARDMTVPKVAPWQWYAELHQTFRRLGAVSFGHVKGHVEKRRRLLGEAYAHQNYCDVRAKQESDRARLLEPQWAARFEAERNPAHARAGLV